MKNVKELFNLIQMPQKPNHRQRCYAKLLITHTCSTFANCVIDSSTEQYTLHRLHLLKTEIVQLQASIDLDFRLRQGSKSNGNEQEKRKLSKTSIDNPCINKDNLRTIFHLKNDNTWQYLWVQAIAPIIPWSTNSMLISCILVHLGCM